jgi:hypothetical protein
MVQLEMDMLRRSLDGASSLNFPDFCGGAGAKRGYMTVSCRVLSMTQLLPAIANQHVRRPSRTATC